MLRILPTLILTGCCCCPIGGGGGDGGPISDYVTERLTEEITEEVIERAIGVEELEIDGDQITVRTEEGTASLGVGTEYPSDFIVEQYAGATVVSVMTTPDGTAVTLQSTDPEADITTWYRSQLEGHGEVTELTMAESTDGAMRSMVQERDTGTLSVGVISSTDSATMITLTWAPQAAE